MRIFHFFVCTNSRPYDNPLPSCSPCGGEVVFEAFRAEIARMGYPKGLKVTSTGCLTPCRIGPNVIVYPEGVWYSGVKAEDVGEIVAAHLEDRIIERLLKPKEARIW